MKITVLTENTTRKNLPVEHGLSLYIETNGHTVLFDAGQTPLFSETTTAADLRPFWISTARHPCILTATPLGSTTTAKDT